jgi:hypothetical protein
LLQQNFRNDKFKKMVNKVFLSFLLLFFISSFFFSKTINFDFFNLNENLQANNQSQISIPSPSPSNILEDKNSDIENQKPLFPPPEEIKAIYITSYVAGIEERLEELINLVKENNLNAIVLDIKDFSGYVSYDIEEENVKKYKTKKVQIKKINSLIKKLHDKEIYVIARITVFQDPALSKARPDLALKDKSQNRLWQDRKNLSWVDPASKEVWDYNLAIAKDAIERGFDEINFDYVRFPSDGNLDNISYPVYDGKKSKREVIKSFMEYLRENTKGSRISIDVFGLTTINTDDLGIGQVIEDAYSYFDFVCPMVYPSHFSSGFLGYQNPALYPEKVVKYSLESALKRLIALQNATSSTSGEKTLINSKIRPWLQFFDLGAKYDPEMIKKEIQAVYDAGLKEGWMLWDPKNRYEGIKEAILF